MLSNLMLGAQYCSSTHCQYEELQLEPSAFQAVRTYASAENETSAGELEELGVGELAGDQEAAPSTLVSPPTLTNLFGLPMFGLTPAAITAMQSSPRAGEPEMEVGKEGDGSLAKVNPGEGEGEASEMLVPAYAAEMA